MAHPTATEQFESAAEELAIGFAPVIGLGAIVTILSLAVTGGAGAVSAFAGATSMVVGLRYWLRYLTE